jgi:hypothetical protein
MNVEVAGESPRSEVRGETVVIAAPVISAPVANERPSTVRQTLATAAIDLGWAAITNQEEAKNARQKMKSEATPPPNAPSKKFVKAEPTTNGPVQSAETATSTVATAAPSAAETTTSAATATPEATATPQRAATVAPTPSQRRGRLLVPNATASPQTTPRPTLTPRTSAETTPAEISLTPIPRVTPPGPRGASQQEIGRGKLNSQTQSLGPRKVEPMVSPSATVTSTSSPNAASSPLISPAGKLSKQEKKEIRREEKQEMKRQHTEGTETPSPSPAP